MRKFGTCLVAIGILGAFSGALGTMSFMLTSERLGKASLIVFMCSLVLWMVGWVIERLGLRSEGRERTRADDAYVDRLPD